MPASSAGSQTQDVMWNKGDAGALSLWESIKTSKKKSIEDPNLLKTWSGRRGSNPRRPAWEYDSQLETKNIAFPGTSFWRLRNYRRVFTLCSLHGSNGAQTEHTNGMEAQPAVAC